LSQGCKFTFVVWLWAHAWSVLQISTVRFPVYFFLLPCGLPSFINVFTLLLPFSTSQNLGIKSAVKMGDYKPSNGLTDRYPVVFHCRFCTFVGLYPNSDTHKWDLLSAVFFHSFYCQLVYILQE
jgi:hypothetical protein